jgi:hypothetical protein
VLDDFARSQAMVEDALDRLSDAAIASPVDPQPPLMAKNVGEMLAGLHFHEAYHVGQTGLLRRLLGKPGSIR